MNEREILLLQKLSQLLGIQTSYLDISGQRQTAAPETLQGVISAFGVVANTPNEIQESITLLANARLKKFAEPVIVAWEGRPAKTEIRFPTAGPRRKFSCRLRLESGDFREISFPRRVRSRGIEFDGQSFSALELQLPKLTRGYHHVEFETTTGIERSLIICAPERSFSAPDLARAWGTFLPLYAARSEQSWGGGNFSDWEKLSRWVGSMGGGVVGSLPILAAFLDDTRCEPSPYSPASRLFWNEFFIDVTSVPELTVCPEARKRVNAVVFQKQLEIFRKNPQVDYCAEMKVRREILEILAQSFFSKNSPRRVLFESFLRDRPSVRDYAQFRAAGEKSKSSWHIWPERLRHGRLEKGDFSEKTARYHMYVQWVAQEQMDNLLRGCRQAGVKFYLDLPLGVNPDGYDVWRERNSFALHANVGAPPDLFFTKGQDWGFAPLHPQKIREQGYRYVLDFLRFQMRHTGLLRIDHVMALHRLYWIPQGRPANEGMYVHYPANELFAILNLESHRHETVLVGENLGTVPPEINRGMKRHHLRQMYVAQYEARPHPKDALNQTPRRVAASLNTHDMPTFAAFWKGTDIADRCALGLVPKSQVKNERTARRKLTTALASFLKRHRFAKNNPLKPNDALRACLRFLSASDAEIVLVNLEDLWGEMLPQNVPGTGPERPNWRRKSRYTVEQIIASQKIRQLLSEVDEVRVNPVSKR